MAAALQQARAKPGRSRAGDSDLHVATRVRQRRIMLGLTQQQLAELIEVTYQQAHNYETGTNRISSGRLYQIAQALSAPIGYFFAGVDTALRDRLTASEITPQQRLLVDLARNFASIGSRQHQDALCQLTHTLANGDAPAVGTDSNALDWRDSGEARLR